MINLRSKLNKKSLIKAQETQNSNRSSSISITTQNSFLIEVENNIDIDDKIRNEINKRFNKSLVNATYKFPRTAEEPFPSIALQQKIMLKESVSKPIKVFTKTFRFVSHTPKPSLNQSSHIRKKRSGKYERNRKVVSITPTQASIVKNKQLYNFPKLKLSVSKSPYLVSPNK